MPEGHARRVYATSRKRLSTVKHAIWVEGDTAPFQYYMTGTPEEIRQIRLKTGQIREGFADCGVYLPTIVAGSQGGHDWDRVPDDEKCINCCRALGELDV